MASLLLVANAAAASRLIEFLDQADPGQFIKEADRIGTPAGNPPIAPLFSNNEKVGFVFLNDDFVDATGYSGKPIHILVAIDMQGKVHSVKLVEHHEPIVLIGIPEERIVNVLNGYVGRDVISLAKGEEEEHKIDAVTGATVTVMVMDDTILRSAVKVARQNGLGGLRPNLVDAGPRKSVNMELIEPADWLDLIASGAVRRMRLTVSEINEAFANSGNAIAAASPIQADDDSVFIELYAALVSIPSIGRSLLGDAEYKNMADRLQPGEQAILLAGDGPYSFKGSGYVRGGIFDRFQLMQGDNAFRFRDYQHKRLRQLHATGAPSPKDIDLFITSSEPAFDPAAAWQLELLVSRDISALDKSFLTFHLDYTPPDRYLATQPAPVVQQSPAWEGNEADGQLWKKLWLVKIPEIVILVLSLVVLTILFFFQGWFVRHPRLLERIRFGFLLFTLFGIGWYANAQLSVVNILAVFNALITGFDWGYFLMEPLIFILWGAVAASLLFWGRGPFCGWLCPFGALQELLNKLAKRLGVKQITVPWAIHERLWPIKYIIFLVLFGVSLHSLGLAEKLAEVEPFKTSIILKFNREWMFVLFALIVLVPGLFMERFYCRYLCPLGAALAIPGRLRMFEWLKRYKECGTRCQVCANECGVQAIHPEGAINVNECFYCMDCQVTYKNDHKCPVMVEQRVKIERREKARAAVRVEKDTNNINVIT